jgi:hypothetical protein
MYIGVHAKYPLFFQIKKTQIFFTYFRKILVLNFMKIRPEEAELFHADAQTDRQT